MQYYPINLDLNGRECLVVGGGGVASRKAMTLVSAGASVTVVAKWIDPKMTGVKRIEREFQDSDVDGKFLVVAATSDPLINKRISVIAHRKNILINIVDNKGLSNFISPSIIDRDPLIIAVSTSGSAPYLSKLIRFELENKYDERYSNLLSVFKEMRSDINNIIDPKAKDAFWENLFSPELFNDLLNMPKTELKNIIKGLLDAEER